LVVVEAEAEIAIAQLEEEAEEAFSVSQMFQSLQVMCITWLLELVAWQASAVTQVQTEETLSFNLYPRVRSLQPLLVEVEAEARVKSVKMEVRVAVVSTEVHQALVLEPLVKAMLAVLSVMTVALAQEPLQAQVAEEQEEWVSAELHLEEVLEVLVPSAPLSEIISAAAEEAQHRVLAAKPFSLVLEDEAEEDEATQTPSQSAALLLLERPTLVAEEVVMEATEAQESLCLLGSLLIPAMTITLALLVTCASTIEHLVKQKSNRLLSHHLFLLQITSRPSQRLALCPTRGLA